MFCWDELELNRDRLMTQRKSDLHKHGELAIGIAYMVQIVIDCLSANNTPWSQPGSTPRLLIPRESTTAGLGSLILAQMIGEIYIPLFATRVEPFIGKIRVGDM